MSTPTPPGSGISLGPAAEATADQIVQTVADALPVALPIAAGLIAVALGWRLFRMFVLDAIIAIRS